MDGTLAPLVPRFAARHRTRRTSQRVLTRHVPGSPGPRPPPLHACSWWVVAAALATSLALHVALVAALSREPVREAAAVHDEPFPVVLIWEAPPAAPDATPAAQAPATQAASKRPRAVSKPPRALSPEPPAPAAPAEAAPARVLPAVAAAPAPVLPAVAAAPAPVLPAVAATPALGESAAPALGSQPWLRALAQPAPHYPHAARRRRAEGIAWLRVDLAASGQVRRVALERTSGHRDLDRAALAAVRRWRFAPLPEEVEASDLWFRVPVEFRLR
jgi:protein TonB